MAGENASDQVSAYLARLLGHALSPEQVVQLRSVHRAAFVSWARSRDLPLRLDLITSGAPVSVRQLLSGDGDAATPAQDTGPVVTAQASSGAGGGPIVGIGIDIEDVQALPQADDYREHPFFKDSFTPAELAHCLRQADMRASFCGTWAAKEAVLKSGLLSPAPGSLRSIEITRDARGRPLFPGCHLSISHTSTSAVAVCVAMSGAPAVAPTASPVLPATPVAPAVGRRRSALHGLFSRAAAVLAATVIGASALLLTVGVFR